MAVTHPEFVLELCREFPGKVIVGLDANNGLVATEGWAKQTRFTCGLSCQKKFRTRWGLALLSIPILHVTV